MLSLADYTVGWICALDDELAAARGMLDEIHSPLVLPRKDRNSYTLGRIGDHNVVIACLPQRPEWLSGWMPLSQISNLA